MAKLTRYIREVSSECMYGMVDDLVSGRWVDACVGETERIPHMICIRLSIRGHRRVLRKLKQWGFKPYEGGTYRRFWEEGVSKQIQIVSEIYVHMGCYVHRRKQQKETGKAVCLATKGMRCLAWGCYKHLSMRDAVQRHGPVEIVDNN